LAITEIPQVEHPPLVAGVGADRFADWTPDERTRALRGALEAEAGMRSLVCDLTVACTVAGDHLDDGQAAMAPWLVEAGAMEIAAARSITRTAAKLQDLPAISAAFSEGLLSWDQIVPAVRFATAENDEFLASELQGWTAAMVAAHAREMRARTPKDSKDADDRKRLNLRPDPEAGGTWINGFRPAEQGATVLNELNRRADQRGPDESGVWDSSPRRLADALFELCDQGAELAPAGHPAVLNVSITAETLAGYQAGNGLMDQMPVGLDVIYRLACDAKLEYSVLSELGDTIGIGRASRNVPWFLRRQVLERDNTCRWKGCSSKIRHCHHVIWWRNLGPTNLDNLIGLCWHHHHKVHEGGWTITGNPNGDVTFHHPNGHKTFTSRPFRPPPRCRERIGT
jgi:hypothetical protein